MKKPTRLHFLLIFSVVALSLVYVLYFGTRKEKTPACLIGHIENLKNRAVQNPPASIIHYRYSGGDAYEITADCCDQMSPLLDSRCEVICRTGGITGNGDGKCPRDLTAIGVVWHDSRT